MVFIVDIKEKAEGRAQAEHRRQADLDKTNRGEREGEQERSHQRKQGAWHSLKNQDI